MKHLGDQNVNGELEVNKGWGCEFGSSGTKKCEMISSLERDIKFINEQTEENFFIKLAARSP